jgi:hypothetical protein
VQRCNERREEKEGVLDSTQRTKPVLYGKIRADNLGLDINVFLFKEVSWLEPRQNYAFGTAPLILLLHTPTATSVQPCASAAGS